MKIISSLQEKVTLQLSKTPKDIKNVKVRISSDVLNTKTKKTLNLSHQFVPRESESKGDSIEISFDDDLMRDNFILFSQNFGLFEIYEENAEGKTDILLRLLFITDTDMHDNKTKILFDQNDEVFA